MYETDGRKKNSEFKTWAFNLTYVDVASISWYIIRRMLNDFCNSVMIVIITVWVVITMLWYDYKLHSTCQIQRSNASWKVVKFKFSHEKPWKCDGIQYQPWKVIERSWNSKYYELHVFIQLYFFSNRNIDVHHINFFIQQMQYIIKKFPRFHTRTPLMLGPRIVIRLPPSKILAKRPNNLEISNGKYEWKSWKLIDT